MSATIQASPRRLSEQVFSNEVSQRTLLLGLGLTSFAALLLELALTRLFSVVLFYHFAFLAISIALLGLGAGGVFAYMAKRWISTQYSGGFGLRKLAARLCLSNSIAVLLVLEIVLHVPVALEVSGANFLRLTILYLAAAVPFFLTGILFSVVFARETRRIPLLYGADLCGGALACLAVVPLLNWIGGPNTILASSVALSVAAATWAPSRAGRRTAEAVLACFLLLIVGNFSGRIIDVVYAKGMFRDPAWVEFARWNALSRVEVDRQNQAKAIVIDADASTYIMNAKPEEVRGTPWEEILMSAPPALANVLRPHGEFAIIGPGGGVDVLRALASGSPSVTGIEINPIIANTIMRGRYAAYSNHLYQRPDVHLQVTDGRSYLRSTQQRFDVVQMTLVDTWASTAAGAFALSENNLYTVEAFEEYFGHLKPDGMIAITRWEFREPREALRVVAVAMEALHRLGVSNPARNFIVASQGALDEDGIPVVVLAKKTAFSAVQRTHRQQRSLRLCPAIRLQCSAGRRQRSVFLFHAESKPDPQASRFARRNRLEGQSRRAGSASGARDIRGGRRIFSDLASGVATRRSSPVSVAAALFCCARLGLHSGGDCFHSALRAVPRASHLCAHRGDLSADAVERRGQPVLTP
jgi:hypothetical protein